MGSGSSELEIRAILTTLGKTMNEFQGDSFSSAAPHGATDSESPLGAARLVSGETGAIFLDSVGAESGVSIVASQPDLVISGGDWEFLEEELRRRASVESAPHGAAIGYVGYDGNFQFGFYNHPHVFDHSSGSWREEPPQFAKTAGPRAKSGIAFEPQVSQTQFMEMVRHAKDYIAAGDIYQVCLAYPFCADVPASGAWRYFENLRAASPAPYSAYLNFGDLRIASSSPECFLRMRGREILTRPIKGTRPRKPESAADRRSAADLVASTKENAELTMITDLERNDLGRVCEYGSVRVSELNRLEKFRQVFHLVSTVEGRLREGVSQVRALRECFPGGSISGAPKVRAMEIIAELEPHARGIYTGAIGYFGYRGESQFSITIRTAVFEEGRASFHVGAGIVADSDPKMEWQETRHKAAGLLLAGD